MSDPETPRAGRAHAEREAAAWFTRLSRRSITTQALGEFRAWKRDPSHRVAYGRVEELWRDAGDLAGDPEIAALCRQALERRPGRSAAGGRERDRGLEISLSLAITATFVLTLLVSFGSLPAVYTSGVGEQRSVRLEDGSVLRLDTDSRAVVAFGVRFRDVRLTRGQALLQVAHDPRRPFRVDANGTVVRALGTVFDVRLSGRDVGVVLLRGAVLVTSPKGDRVMLRPGEGVRAVAGGLARPGPVDPHCAVSWAEGRLIFARTPLAAAVAEVNRYARVKIDLEAPDLAAAPVSGVFNTGDVGAVAAALSAEFGLQTIRADDREIVLRPREVSAR